MQVEREVVLPAPRSEVWRAITDAAELGGWFGAVPDADLQAGATATFRDEDGDTLRAVVDEVEPERRLRFRWWRADGQGPLTEVAFDLTEDAGGTRLRVEERLVPLPPVRRRFEGYVRRPASEARHLALVRA